MAKYLEREVVNKRMDSKTKHPFAITCRKCGSNRISVTAEDWNDLTISCKNCGAYLDCGVYRTYEGDYSDG